MRGTHIQTSLEFARHLTQKGINQAENHANAVHDSWTDQALNFLKNYMKENRTFMAEDVRVAAEGTVPTPPSLRAWGAIILKAKKFGWLRHRGFQSVKNPRAHRAPCNVWEVVSQLN